MNNNSDQFKYAPNKNVVISDWSTLIERADELLSEDISRIPLEVLFDELKIIRGGIQQISDMIKNDITADEQTMNQLAEDFELLEATKEKLLIHLRKREVERSSHKEALESRANSFLDNDEMMEMEEDEEDSPEKAGSPKIVPEDIQNVPLKCELKFEKDLKFDFHKDLIKKDGQYFRKMKDGSQIKLNSQVEIQDEEDGDKKVKKKVITLSMPREDKPVVEGLRKSHSESIPVNLEIDPDLYKRAESDKDQYSNKGYTICSNQVSGGESQIQNQMGDPRMANSEETQRKISQEGKGQTSMEDDMFKKNGQASEYEEVSGDLKEEEWRRQQTGGGSPQMQFEKTEGSNMQMSDLKSDQEIRMPFQESQAPETIDHVDSIEDSKQEVIMPAKKIKRSIKEIIMDQQRYEETETNGTDEHQTNFDGYTNGEGESKPLTRHASQEEGGGKVDIYSRENSGVRKVTQESENDLNDTSRKFYTSNTREVYNMDLGGEVDQQNETSKKPFYPKNEVSKKNTLNELISQQKEQSHREKMNELNTQQNSDHLRVNLESLQTVNSNWIPGKDESGYESINQGKQKGKSQFSDENSKQIKSLNEIVHETMNRHKDTDYYSYRPANLERISHPDEPNRQGKRREKGLRPRERPYEVREERREQGRPKKFGVKEKRLSHKSKMIILPMKKREWATGKKMRGLSLEEYNKRASSLTMKTSRYSRQGREEV